MRPPLILLTLVLVLTACAGDDANTTSDASSEPTTVAVDPAGGIGDGPGPTGAPGGLEEDDEAPPAFEIAVPSAALVVNPYRYCLDDAPCMDDTPTADPVLVVEDDILTVTYLDGELQAASAETFDPNTAQDRTAVPVTAIDDGAWQIDVTQLDQGDHALWLDWTGPSGEASAVLTITTPA